jgi:hypothetical protein
MKFYFHRLFIVWMALFAVLGMAGSSYGQASGEGTSASKDQPQPKPDAESLWTRITKADPYKDWKPYPAKGKEGLYPAIERGRTPATNPHGAYMKLFINETALKAAQQNASGPMPDGAILVMENYGRDKKTLQSIHVMYKVKEVAPEQGDWFWAAYSPDGKASEAGKVKNCIDCHKARQENDWKWAGSRGHQKGHQGHN